MDTQPQTLNMTDHPYHLVQDTRQVHLSTKGGAGQILNGEFKSSVAFSVPNLIHAEDDIEYILFSIPYAVIPNSYYIVNDSNNRLVITENSITTTYTLANGNYNASTFRTAILALLPSPRWGCSLNSITNKFTFTNTTYSFTFGATSTIDFIIGFSDAISSSLVSLVNTLTMPRVCNFMPLPRICIRCYQLAHSVVASANVSGSTGDVLITVPNNAVANGQMVFNNYSQAKTLFKLNKLQSFVVNLTDDDGTLIDFNGISSFFVFQFDIFRRHIPKPPSLKDIVNYVGSKNF
jgi:hypothetical protein